MDKSIFGIFHVEQIILTAIMVSVAHMTIKNYTVKITK